MKVRDLIELTVDSDGAVVGRCISGVSNRIFGGQTLAQALQAASRALDSPKLPGALHACFVSAGDPTRPVQYVADVIKRGRSLDVVTIDARQDHRILMNAIVTFRQPEISAEFQIDPPSVPKPEDLLTDNYVPPGSNAVVRAPFELKFVGSDYRGSEPAPAIQDVWIRARSELATASAADHASLLTYAVDFLVTRAARQPLRTAGQSISGASLDHSMWFHKSFRVDEWLLVSSRGLAYAGARALSQCHVFDRDGALVATASQQAMLRPVADSVDA